MPEIYLIGSSLFYKVFFVQSVAKGRTIRKVMGGEGDFQLARFFFFALSLCRNFFCR